MDNTKVKLEMWNGTCKDFEFEQAVRLLKASETDKCWKLPKNSLYTYKNGNIITRANKADSEPKRTEQPLIVSDTPREEN